MVGGGRVVGGGGIWVETTNINKNIEGYKNDKRESVF